LRPPVVGAQSYSGCRMVRVTVRAGEIAHE
jgi:hypothetical protein